MTGWGAEDEVVAGWLREETSWYPGAGPRHEEGGPGHRTSGRDWTPEGLEGRGFWGE